MNLFWTYGLEICVFGFDFESFVDVIGGFVVVFGTVTEHLIGSPVSFFDLLCSL